MIERVLSELKFYYNHSEQRKKDGNINFIFSNIIGPAIFIFIASIFGVILIGASLSITDHRLLPGDLVFSKLHYYLYIFLLILSCIFFFKFIKRYNAERIKKSLFWEDQDLFMISAPKQGMISIIFSKEELRSWLRETKKTLDDFLKEINTDESPKFLKESIENTISDIRNIYEAFDENPQKSSEILKCLIDDDLICLPESRLGKFIYRNSLLNEDDQPTLSERLLCLVMFFSGKYKNDANSIQPEIHPLSNQIEQLYERYEVLRFSGPTKVMFALTLNAAPGLERLESELKKATTLGENLDRALKNARAKLKLVPASRRWQRSARLSSFLALIGLAPFLMLLIGLPYILWLNWGETTEGLTQFIYTQDEQEIKAIERWQKFFVEAPWATFVFVTVPVLLFAWTLKHFSRIFVQNMNLASDAGRRAALADVYSRIVSDPDLNKEGNAITDEQKKIIFEAMFQPRDPRHTDDGIDHSPIEKLFQMGGKKR